MTLTLETTTTTTNGTHESFDLDAALARALAVATEREQVKAQADQERTAQFAQRDAEQTAARRAAFQERLDADLPRGLQAAVGLRITENTEFAATHSRYWSGVIADHGTWRLEWFPARDQWYVTAPWGHGASVAPADLEQELLIGLALNRDTIAQRRAQFAAMQQCSAELAERIAEAEAALRWTWPQDTTVTIYHWRWSTSYDGSDEETGYSLSDCLTDGWLHLEATAYDDARTVRLIPAYHLPVVERVVIRSLDEVPDGYGTRLLERETADVPGIDRVIVDHPDTGETVSLYREDANAVHEGELVKRPVAWLRELAESGGLADATPLPFEVTPQQVEVERLRSLIARAYHVITNPDRQPFSRDLIEVLREMEAVIDEHE